MSRLYSWLESDTLKTTHTARGNQEINFRVHYGSSSNSRKLLDIRVYYPKGADKPTVTIEQGV